MGGNMALAAAQLKPESVSALALFASPWDFHCKDFSSFVLDQQWLPMVESMLASQKQLPAEVVQSLFYLTDPFIFEQKFRRFAGLQSDSRMAKDFIALEHWVNDGVPMTAKVAHDCLIGWAQENQMAKGKWQVAGKTINPKKIKLPTFIAIPRQDHVVPQTCAQPLADTMLHAHVIHPGSGHVSMIVGNRAKKELWQPFAEWVNHVS
jgi:polyhydroxyalkanoate synthase